MNNNQINGQKNNKEAYRPNPIFNNGTVSIGEFKTIEDAMNFPMQEIWCINRTQDNKFNSYVSQGCRLLIICDWGKSIQDSQKFVVALISKSGKITYWDLNDLPINTRQYENSIDNDVLTAIYAVADELYRNNNQLNCNLNMNKKQIRLTESDLKQIVKESVGKILNEAMFNGDYISDEDYDARMAAYDETAMDDEYTPTKQDIQSRKEYDKAEKCLSFLYGYARSRGVYSAYDILEKLSLKLGVSLRPPQSKH